MRRFTVLLWAIWGINLIAPLIPALAALANRR